MSKIFSTKINGITKENYLKAKNLNQRLTNKAYVDNTYLNQIMMSPKLKNNKEFIIKHIPYENFNIRFISGMKLQIL